MKRLLMLIVLGSGCTTALSTAQPAETLPKGTWRASGGMEIGVPVSRIADALDAAATLEEKIADDPNYMPTAEEQREYEDAAIGLALNAPGPIVDLMLRRGFGHHLELGGRYTSTGFQIDGKFQFLDGAWDGAISVGYARHAFKGLIFDVLELLKVDDFSRNDILIPVIFGRPLGDYGRVWFGPRLQIAFVHVDGQLEKVGDIDTDATIYYVGGFGGVSAGYKGIEAYVELTVMEMIAKPTIFGEKRDLGGIVVAPTLGLSARF
jgi:hypothetical protein